MRLVRFACAATVAGAGPVGAQVCGLRPLKGPGSSGRVVAVLSFDDRQSGERRPHVIGTNLTIGGQGPTSVLRRVAGAWEAVPGGPASLNSACVHVEGGREYLYILSGDQLHRFDGSAWAVEPIELDLPFWYSSSIASMDEDGDGPSAPRLFLNAGYEDGIGHVSFLNAYVFVRDDGVWDGLGSAPLGKMMVYDADAEGPQVAGLYIAGYSGASYKDPYPGWVARWRAGVMSSVAWANWPWAMAVHDADGPGPERPKLYLGGSFTSVSGVPAQRVAAWDGATWSAVGAGLVSGAAGALASFDDDGPGPGRPRLVAAGSFTRAGGDPADGLAAWDGQSWSEFGGGITGPGSGRGPLVDALAAFREDGEEFLLLAGDATVAGRSASPIVVWRDARWEGCLDGPGGPVLTLALFNEGQGRRLFAAGRFEFCGDTVVNNIARWDGSAWTAVGGGIEPTTANPSPIILATAVHNDGAGWALYVGGSFRAAGGVPVSNVARWTGAAWESVGDGVAGGAVHALEVFDADGPGPEPSKLYAGGAFTSAGGAAAQHLAVWDGASWSAVAPVVQYAGAVRAIRAFQENAGPTLYVGGDPLSIAGLPTNLAFRFRGGSWQSLPPMITLPDPGTVNAFAYHNRGDAYRVYAVGRHAAGKIGLLNGTVWMPLTPDSPPWASWWYEGYAARSVSDGDEPVLHANSMRFVGVGPGQTVSGNPAGVVRAISPVFDDGNGAAVFMAGDFQRLAGGAAVSRVARLPLCSACYANCDASTAAPVLNVSDFSCFLQRFAAADPWANCDQSTATPALNIADFTCFLQRYAEGCP
jgi:hypothetical protein